MGDLLQPVGRQTRRQFLLTAASFAPLAASASAEEVVRSATIRAANTNFIEIEPREDVSSVKLKGLNGETLRLGKLRGRPALVSFWASWCPPCQRELPVFHQLQQEARDLPFTLLPVSVDRDAATAKAFLQRLGLRGFRSFIDPHDGIVSTGPNSAHRSAFMLYGMPLTYVVDTSGRTAGYWTGESDLRAPDTLAFVRRLG